MRVVDDKIMELLGYVIPPIVTDENIAAHPDVDPGDLTPEVRIHDGLVRADNSTKVVTYALPYIRYESSIGNDDDQSARLTGRRVWRSVFWSLLYVGSTRNQAKWAGERAREQLAGRKVNIDGYPTRKITLEASQRVRRDDDAVRPDGSPLFYGVDEYAMGVFITEVPALVGA